jgi:fibronectin-binding autotransporter adhesin
MGKVGKTRSRPRKSVHLNRKQLGAAAFAVIGAATLVAFVPAVHAQNVYVGLDNPGVWNDNQNWSLGHVPTSAEDAIVNNGDTINYNTGDTVNSFTTNGFFNILGGSLGGSQANQASPFQFNNNLEFNGGGLFGCTISAGNTSTITVDNNGGNFLSDGTVNPSINFAAGYMQLYNTVNVVADWTLAGGNIQLHDGNTNLAISATGEVNGSGLVNQYYGGAVLTNAGLVSADVSGQTLTLSNSTDTGAGTYQAINGATLAINGNLFGSSTVVHADTGTVLIDGGEISGTVASATGSGFTFSSNGNNSIQGANITGNLTFGSGGYTQAYGTNSITGTVAMASTSNTLQLHDGNTQVTLAPTSLMHGYGIVVPYFGGGTLEDDGTISADTAGQALILNNSDTTGTGILDARNGGTLSIGGLLNGTGIAVNVDSNPASLVQIDSGALTGSIGSTTGTGLSFSSNGNNYISGATVNGRLTFGSGAYSQIYTSNTLNGTIAMASTTNGIQFHDGNTLLHISSTGTLHGYGATYNYFGGGTLQDDGTINADASAQTLTLANSNITGSGTLEATNSGILSIGGTLNGTAMTIHADTGTVIVDGGNVTGSYAAATGSGISFSPNGNNYVSAASISGNLTFGTNAYSQFYNLSVVDGVIAMTDSANGIQLHDGNTYLVINPAASMHGYGNVYEYFGGGTLTNNGTLSADTTSQILTINSTNLTGSGILNAQSGGVLSIGALLNASNMQVNVDSNPSSAVEINGGALTGTLGSTTGNGLTFTNNGNNYVSAAAVNGTLSFLGNAYSQFYNSNTINGSIVMANTSNGLQIHDGNASINISSTGSLSGFGAIYQYFGGGTVSNAGQILADTPGQTLTFAVDTTLNTGTIEVGPSSNLAINGSFIQTAGATLVNGTLDLLQPFALNGGLLDGIGTISGTVNNNAGVVSPGDAPGILDITGNYNQGPLGELNIQIGGYIPAIDYSQLNVLNGTANLNGRLNVVLVNNFRPQIGDVFNILLSQNENGAFSSTTSSYNGLVYQVSYHPTVTQIMIIAVPEPATISLLAAGATLLLHRRRRFLPT